jgi:hypothetical protein
VQCSQHFVFCCHEIYLFCGKFNEFIWFVYRSVLIASSTLLTQVHSSNDMYTVSATYSRPIYPNPGSPPMHSASLGSVPACMQQPKIQKLKLSFSKNLMPALNHVAKKFIWSLLPWLHCCRTSENYGSHPLLSSSMI